MVERGSGVETNWKGSPLNSYREVVRDQMLLKEIPEKEIDSPLETVRFGLPIMLSESSFKIQAPTGTGKTPLLLLGVILQLRPNLESTQFILIQHRKYLVTELYKDLKEWTSHLEIRIAICTGDQEYAQCRREVRGAHIIVGTFARIYNMMKKNFINTQNLKVFCVDSPSVCFCVDYSLDVLGSLFRRDTKFWWFGINEESFEEEAMRTLSPEYYYVKLNTLEEFLNKTSHSVIEVDSLEQKLEVTKSLCYKNSKPKIIFCNEETIEEVSDSLSEELAVVQITKRLMGEKPNTLLKLFEDGRAKIVVLPGVQYFARKLNCKQVVEVINFDFPSDVENYIMRTRRNSYVNGDKIINLVANQEERLIVEEIQSTYNTRFKFK